MSSTLTKIIARSKWQQEQIHKEGSPADHQNLASVSNTRGWAVCRITIPPPNIGNPTYGTGILIGGNLLLTNYHVLPSLLTAQKSSILFTQTILKEGHERTTKTIGPIDLEGAQWVCHSYNQNSNSLTLHADQDHLDFTIIEIPHHPYLDEIQDRVFDIFHSCVPQTNRPAIVLHHPDVMNRQTYTPEGLIPSEGVFKTVDDYSIYYNTTTAPGSSGGAVIDENENLVALHHIGDIQEQGGWYQNNSGVLISAIVQDLERSGKSEEIQSLIATYRREHSMGLSNSIEHRLRTLYLKRKYIPLLIEPGELEIETIYTTLAIVGEDEQKSKQASIKEVKPGEVLDGRIPTHESFFETRTPIKPEELFDHKALNDKEKKRAIIYGSAGIGKSTFCQHIAYRWAQGTLWKQFSHVFLVRLRNLNKSFFKKGESYSAAHILAHECQISFEDAHRFLTDEKFIGKTLLILDGEDELPAEAGRGNKAFLREAFEELQRIFPHILVTSRPQLTSISDCCRLEILGFDQLGINKYVSNFFREDQTGKSKLENHLKNPLMRSLAHIPINLEIFCSLAKQHKELFDPTRPLTMTLIYNSVTDWFCRRFLMGKAGVSEAKAVQNPLPAKHPSVAKQVQSLEDIAWKAMEDDTLYLSDKDVTEICYARGLEGSAPIESLGPFRVNNTVGHFIHLTFQEYYAASKLARLYIEDPQQAKALLRKIKLEPRYQLVLHMTAGCLSLQDKEKLLQQFFDDLFSEPYDLAETYELELIARCFAECEKPEKIDQYKNFINKIVSFIYSTTSSYNISLILCGNDLLIKNEKIINLITNNFLKNRLDDSLFILNRLVSNQHTIPAQIITSLCEIFKRDSTKFIRRFEAINIIESAGLETSQDAVIALTTCFEQPEMVDSMGSAAKAIKNILAAGGNVGMEAVAGLVALSKASSLNKEAHCNAVDCLVATVMVGDKVGDKLFEELIAFLTNPSVNKSIVYPAILALERVAVADNAKSHKACLVFVEVLKDSNMSNRMSAVNSLMRISFSKGDVSQFAFKTLAEILQKSSQKSVADAMVGIALAGGDFGLQAISELVAVINHPPLEETKRHFAVESLGAIARAGHKAGSKAVTVLVEFMREPLLATSTRSSALNTLNAIAKVGDVLGSEVVTLLDNIIKNSSLTGEERYAAGSVLTAIAQSGSDISSEAVNVLRAVLKNSDLDNYARYVASSHLADIIRFGVRINSEVVKELIVVLKDTSLAEYTRHTAVSALKAIARPGNDMSSEAIEALIIVLGDIDLDQYAHYSAISTFAEIVQAGIDLNSESVEALITVLQYQSLDENTRSLAVDILKNIVKARSETGLDTVETLAITLQESSLSVDMKQSVSAALSAIVMAKSKVKSQPVLELIKILQESLLNAETRNSAAAALAASVQLECDESIKTVAALVDILKSPSQDQSVRRASAEAIGAIARKGVVVEQSACDELVTVLKCSLNDESLQKSVADAMGYIALAGGDFGLQAISELVAVLNNSLLEETTRNFAVESLGSIARAGRKVGSEAVAALVTFMQEPSLAPSTRSSAVDTLRAISKVGDVVETEMVLLLMKSLQDPHLNVDAKCYIATALEVIANTGIKMDRNTILELISFLQSPSLEEDIRSSAVFILGNLAHARPDIGDACIVGLVNLLQEGSLDVEVRCFAACALGTIAQACIEMNSKAIAALVAFSEEPSMKACYRHSAVSALCMIAQAGIEINSKAIDKLVSFLQAPNMDIGMQIHAADALEATIRVRGNVDLPTVNALVVALNNSSLCANLQYAVFSALEVAAKGKDHASQKALEALIEVMKEDSTSEVLRNSIVSALIKRAHDGDDASQQAIEELIEVMQKFSLSSGLRNSIFSVLIKHARIEGSLNQNALNILIEAMKDVFLDQNMLDSIISFLINLVRTEDVGGRQILDALVLVAKKKIIKEPNHFIFNFFNKFLFYCNPVYYTDTMFEICRITGNIFRSDGTIHLVRSRQSHPVKEFNAKDAFWMGQIRQVEEWRK